MAKHALLNNIEHALMKIRTERSAELGDAVWYCPVYTSEIRAAQTSFPLFFTKDEDTGRFNLVALFGFEQGENLFLTEQGWAADYVPLMLLRQPFYIGRQSYTEDGEEHWRRVVHIDLDSPRISQEQGVPLFKEFGGNSPYLDSVTQILDTIHSSLEDTDQFIHSLTQYNLLEPFSLQVTLNNGSLNEMQGFYTLNEDSLKQLNDAAIVELHRSGYLECIYLILASASRVSFLIQQKNHKMAHPLP